MEINNILKETYNNKKVFLTGHTGFKGTWLTTWLSELGAIIKGYSLAPDNENDFYNLINGDSLCKTSVIADILDKNRLEKEILDFEPDFIFHLAAQALVRHSYEDPLKTFEVNTLGTAYLLDSVRRLNKKCTLVIITTDKVYENKEWIYPYRESDRLGGHDPYSSSKAMAEIITSSYISSFFHLNKYNTHNKGIATARAGNVIGGGDWSKDRIIPDSIRALIKNEPVIIRNPNSVRPWQLVLEPLLGYLMLGQKLNMDPISYSGSWNFGPHLQDNILVQELVEIAIEQWGKGTYTIASDKNAPHEARLLKLDISKAVTQLGWKPKLNSKAAIHSTVEWYKNNNKNPESIKNYTFECIKEYSSIKEKDLLNFI